MKCAYTIKPEPCLRRTCPAGVFGQMSAKSAFGTEALPCRKAWACPAVSAFTAASATPFWAGLRAYACLPSSTAIFLRRPFTGNFCLDSRRENGYNSTVPEKAGLFCRRRTTASTSAFQAEDVGSTPIACSKKETTFVGRANVVSSVSRQMGRSRPGSGTEQWAVRGLLSAWRMRPGGHMAGGGPCVTRQGKPGAFLASVPDGSGIRAAWAAEPERGAEDQ